MTLPCARNLYRICKSPDLSDLYIPDNGFQEIEYLFFLYQHICVSKCFLSL